MPDLSAVAGPSKDDLLRGPLRRDGRLVVSYPKSGRTWLRFALWKGQIDATLTHAGASTGWREIGRPYRDIPKALQDLPVVFLHRNPLDTAVSMFYQVTRRDLPRGSARWWRLALPLWRKGALPPQELDAFVLHPILGIENICAYSRLWLDRLAGDGRSLILTYEGLRNDPAQGFQHLLDHWDEQSVTGADLAEAASLDAMRRAEQEGTAFLATRQRKGTDANSAKVRRGKVRGYLDDLHPETIRRARDIAARYQFEL